MVSPFTARAVSEPADASGTVPQPAANDAIRSLMRELDAAPGNIALHDVLSHALEAAGNRVGALAHRVAVDTLTMLGEMGRDAPALALYNLATVYYLKGDDLGACAWFERTLALAPGLAIAHQNYAAVLDRLDRKAEADTHRRRAYALQRVYVEPAANAPRRVLILCSARVASNIPFDTLLPPQVAFRIKYAIDCAEEAEDATLPPFDLVFNAIGEPDVAVPLTPRLEAFARRCERPMLNRPSAVAATQRHRLPALLDEIDDAFTAPCIRLDDVPATRDALASRLARPALGVPLMMRPLSTHGGEGVQRHASIDTLWSALEVHAAACYLTQFVDYRSADGYYRKYRVIFIGGRPYAYHLAISPHWMVHYVTADMTSAPWKLDEERRFLDDMGAALGERALRALEAIGRRLALDYAGIDFTLLEDGRVLVFEANATMLVHGEARDGVLAHKNAYVQRILDAFEHLQASRVSEHDATLRR